ncbi:hypothetical protein NHP21005_19310 (plasmid) [Helicobacter sp. NHP21005]|uniref:hypothetical protein n=1 Tax=Helicobacter felistomachi TaxID=3040201 RepID=UPI002572812C|nr:hypothetical protein [Helicobacter sp. NHP21005]BEG58243.1 hypothetical protein NHP21005_19310 [Helicobacter sp. NHP21005]
MTPYGISNYATLAPTKGYTLSRKERLKLEIDVLKVLIVALLTAIFGTFGFVTINYLKVNLVQGIVISTGLVILFSILVILFRRLFADLNEIEEMEE